MPYYRRRGNRYGRKTKRYQKGWWKKKVARKGKGDSGVRLFKLRKVVEVPVDVGGGFSGYSSLSSPDKTWANANPAEDVTNVGSLFDSYRVCAFKIKWIPAFIDNQVGATTFLSFKPIYSFIDYDAQASSGLPVSTVGTVMQYENCKTFNMNRMWKRYIRVPKSTGGFGTDFKGFHDLGTPLDQGLHCLYAPNVGTGLATDTVLGTVVLTYYLAYKHRR